MNGALLAYDDDFDVLGVDGLALDDSDILDMESIELVVEPSSWLAEVNDSDFVVVDRMTPVAETNDRLKKVDGVTVADIATLVVTPGE